jgi:hypothetical protein
MALTRKAPTLTPTTRKAPPKKVNKRALKDPDAIAPEKAVGFSQFGDGNIDYGKLPPLQANGTPDGLFHQYRGGNSHSFLAMGDGKGDFVQASKFEFWVTGVQYGYGSGGSTAQSKLFAIYYAKSFSRTPLSITGRVPNEKYKVDLQNWIRAGQINMARGKPRMRLVIPAANIAVWGYIASIKGGIEAGFEPAPEISFDFVVTRDVRIDKKSEISNQIIAYFLDPQDKYWRNQSNIFIDTTYDALESEIREELDKQKEQKVDYNNLRGWF